MTVKQQLAIVKGASSCDFLSSSMFINVYILEAQWQTGSAVGSIESGSTAGGGGGGAQPAAASSNPSIGRFSVHAVCTCCGYAAVSIEIALIQLKKYSRQASS